MTIDASAVARVLGIETTYKDLREGAVLYLPQRIAVIAQGATDAAYGSTKFAARTAGEVGSKVGYGSPAHLAMLQLQPINGDGVGTVPVTVYPLQQAAGATEATGDITALGTQTRAASYRVKVGGIRSSSFTIPVGASVSDILGSVMVAIQSVLEMPVTVLPTYGAAASTPGTNTGNGTVTALSVVGTPRPGSYKLAVTGAISDGGKFVLSDPDGIAVSSVTLTPAPGGTTEVDAAGLQFTVTDGTTDFVVGDNFTIEVPATKLDLTSKWKGSSANAIRLSVEGESYGVSFAFTQPSGGAGNPSVASALGQIVDVWETLILNGLDVTDTEALDELATFGEQRWGELVRKPFVSFVGTTAAAVAEATAVSAGRRTDRVNAQIVSPGAEDLPVVVAARALARIARIANNNPPRDYGSQRLTGLTPGPDGAQWDYRTRDMAVKNGSSTIEIKDGIVCLSDVVTFYRPTGEEPPGFRYVCDIVKLQNIIFNLSLIFENEDWDGAPLVPNDQPVVNYAARKPKDAVAAANALIDSLGLYAFLSDPASAKKKTTASINAMNPKRLDLRLIVQLSGNTVQKGIELGFGFYFGASAAA